MMTQDTNPDQSKSQGGDTGAASTDSADSVIMLLSAAVALVPTFFVARLIWDVDWLWTLGSKHHIYKTGIYSLAFGSLFTFMGSFVVILAAVHLFVGGVRAGIDALRRH